MRIEGLIWLEDIADKLVRKHGVEEHEVFEVLQRKPQFRFIEKGHRVEEDVYAALGQTASGRYLTVFFVYKKDRQALILSARAMTRSERRLYDRR